MQGHDGNRTWREVRGGAREKLCGNLGYAIFLERALDGRLVAKVIGDVPTKRLSELKKDFSAFAFEKA